jgi:hypothetical protein
MPKRIRRMVLGAALLALAGGMRPAAARADDPLDMTDYATYWRVATDTAPSDPRVDSNTYWAEVEAKQAILDRQR